MKWSIMNLIPHKSHPSNQLNHPPPYRYHHHHAPSHLNFQFPLPILGSFLDSLRPGKSMWSPWGRSSPSPVRRASPRPSFPCSSFKDVPRLYSDDDDPPTRPHNENGIENHDPNPHPLPAPACKKAVFHRVRVASALLRNWPGPARARPRITTPGAEARVVVYLTSLRAIRPTSEACRAVQSIFTGFRVTIDERDVAMDSGLLEEVQRILGVTRERLKLPAVFVGGWYIGGAEEVRQMNEVGELKSLVESLPEADPRACDGCGGYRFVLCAECNGSRKVYGSKAVGFTACTACNENGLIKCPSCYPTALVPR